MMYQCGRCGLTRASGQAMGLAMPQCQCPWEFNPPVAQTTPPVAEPHKRTWIGLTDEEIDILHRKSINTGAKGWGFLNHERFAKDIETKLKEKNGYE